REAISAPGCGEGEEPEQGEDGPCPTIAPLHTNCSTTAIAFSACNRRLSATNQNQQAVTSLRSGMMAPIAIPPCPACPTLVGGSVSSPCTSMTSMASELSMASISGGSSNSTH